MASSSCARAPGKAPPSTGFNLDLLIKRMYCVLNVFMGGTNCIYGGNELYLWW